MDNIWLIENGDAVTLSGKHYYLTLNTKTKDIVTESVNETGIKVLWTPYPMQAMRFLNEGNAKSWLKTVFGNNSIHKIVQHEWTIEQEELEEILKNQGIA